MRVLDHGSLVIRKLTGEAACPHFTHSAGNQRARNRTDLELAGEENESGRGMGKGNMNQGMHTDVWRREAGTHADQMQLMMIREEE